MQGLHVINDLKLTQMTFQQHSIKSTYWEETQWVAKHCRFTTGLDKRNYPPLPQKALGEAEKAHFPPQTQQVGLKNKTKFFRHSHYNSYLLFGRFCAGLKFEFRLKLIRNV